MQPDWRGDREGAEPQPGVEKGEGHGSVLTFSFGCAPGANDTDSIASFGVGYNLQFAFAGNDGATSNERKRFGGGRDGSMSGRERS